MSKFIAVEGCVLTTDNPTAQASIIDPASLKVKALNKGVYKDKATVQVTGATQGSFVQTAPVTTVFDSTAVKVKADNILVLLEGDKTNTPAMCPAVDPNGAATTIAVTVTIQQAGQTKVKGN